jgi:hypothetical protein
MAYVTIPALSFWTHADLDAAARLKTRFLISSNMGGIFYARIVSWNKDEDHGQFIIDHPQAGDFHGKDWGAKLSEVTRATGTLPCLAEPKRREIAAQLAVQNDRFRSTFGADFTIPGSVVFSEGVEALGGEFMQAAMVAVMQFDRFTPENDPHGDHGFGIVTVNGTRIFWKIDLFGTGTRWSEAPADTTMTRRVLTIFLPTEN